MILFEVRSLGFGPASHRGFELADRSSELKLEGWEVDRELCER